MKNHYILEKNHIKFGKLKKVKMTKKDFERPLYSKPNVCVK